jgi:hypothetical protein
MGCNPTFSLFHGFAILVCHLAGFIKIKPGVRSNPGRWLFSGHIRAQQLNHLFAGGFNLLHAGLFSPFPTTRRKYGA